MSDMHETETIERFVEGMKKAAACSRQLAAAQKNDGWLKLATVMDGIRVNGVKLFNGRALNRQDTLTMLDQRQKQLKIT